MLRGQDGRGAQSAHQDNKQEDGQRRKGGPRGPHRLHSLRPRRLVPAAARPSSELRVRTADWNFSKSTGCCCCPLQVRTPEQALQESHLVYLDSWPLGLRRVLCEHGFSLGQKHPSAARALLYGATRCFEMAESLWLPRSSTRMVDTGVVL